MTFEMSKRELESRMANYPPALVSIVSGCKMPDFSYVQDRLMASCDYSALTEMIGYLDACRVSMESVLKSLEMLREDMSNDYMSFGKARASDPNAFWALHYVDQNDMLRFFAGSFTTTIQEMLTKTNDMLDKMQRQQAAISQPYIDFFR